MQLFPGHEAEDGEDDHPGEEGGHRVGHGDQYGVPVTVSAESKE